MSGGTFDYNQYIFTDAVETIEIAIKQNNVKDEWGYCNDYNPETLRLFEIAKVNITQAAAMMQRVDWLMAGDDGEDSFKERWEEEGLPL